MMKSWADLVDEDSNELTFLNQPPNFARNFDPLLDDSSKLGLNKEFASSVVLNEASQHAAIEQDNANHAHSAQPTPANPANPADSEHAKPLNFSGLIKPSEPAQREGSPSLAAKTYANVARSTLPEHGIATNTSVQIFDDPLSSDVANSAPANVSTPTPQDSPSKRTAKAETPKSHKIAHSKTRTPGSSPYRSKRETDPHRISQREKQLSMGKNTVGYQLYTSAISRDARSATDPRTPDPYQMCSKRSWDGQVSKWRRMLHQWDPHGEPEPEFDVEMSEVSESQFESSERSVHEEHEEHDNTGKQ